MEVEVFLIAAGAAFDEGGNVSLSKIIYSIDAMGFPCSYEKFAAAVGIRVETNELSKLHKFSIVLADDDGKQIGEVGSISIGARNKSGQESLKLQRTMVALNCPNVIFPEQGVYEFLLYINDELKATWPVDVVLKR